MCAMLNLCSTHTTTIRLFAVTITNRIRISTPNVEIQRPANEHCHLAISTYLTKKKPQIIGHFHTAVRKQGVSLAISVARYEKLQIIGHFHTAVQKQGVSLAVSVARYEKLQIIGHFHTAVQKQGFHWPFP
jgi:dihydroxyacetone kinase